MFGHVNKLTYLLTLLVYFILPSRYFGHPSVTDLVEPDLVSYFALLGGILTSLAPDGFLKTPW